MVRGKVNRIQMYTTYHLEPGQVLEDVKVADRQLALVASKSIYQRFVDYTTENERLAAERDREAAELDALKKASHELTKTWDNTVENTRRRRREELLSRRKKEDEQRREFVKEMAEKSAAERAEIVRDARRLLLHRKTLCNRINRALLRSECLRELEAQATFQKVIKELDKKGEEEYVNLMKADVATYEAEQKRKDMDQSRRNRNYGMELRRQIMEKESSDRTKERDEMEAGRQDQKNISRDLDTIKRCEAEEALKKKKKLLQSFKDAIEEKKRYELKLKQDDEFENRALEIYRNSKARIEKLQKSIAKEEREIHNQKRDLVQSLAEKQAEIQRQSEIREGEMLQKAIDEKETGEEERRKARKDRQDSVLVSAKKYKLQTEAIKAQQVQREKELKTWEMLQRFKRDECDKEFEAKERKREYRKKLHYANELQEHVAQKEDEWQREKALENKAIKVDFGPTNQRILDYAEEVLKESKGKRPLYPIIKAIEECKKDMGLKESRETKETTPLTKPKEKSGIRRGSHKYVSPDQILYLR